MIKISILILAIAYIIQITKAGEMDCKPDFELKGEFYGGDAIYGVPLGDNVHFWIFGDTFTTPDRDFHGMIGNSVALSVCESEETSSIDYFISSTSTNETKTTHGFFELPQKEEGVRLWPKDAFLLDKQLHVILVKVKQDGNGAMDFKLIGNVIATIINIFDEPSKWRVYYRMVMPERRPDQLLLAASILRDERIDKENIYMYSLFEPKPTTTTKKSIQTLLNTVDKPMVLIKSPVANWTVTSEMIRKNGDYQEKEDIYYLYLAKDGAFKAVASDSREDMATLLPMVNNEFSVRFHPESSQFIMVFTDPITTNTIQYRTAPSLTGPFSEATTIYVFPEMDPKSEQYNDKAFCYASKEHLAFQTNEDMLVTYCCNTMSFEELVNNMDIYIPKPVYLPLPDI